MGHVVCSCIVCSPKPACSFRARSTTCVYSAPTVTLSICITPQFKTRHCRVVISYLDLLTFCRPNTSVRSCDVFLFRATLCESTHRARFIPAALLLGIVVIFRLDIRHPFDSISCWTFHNIFLKLATLAHPSIVVKYFSDRPFRT